MEHLGQASDNDTQLLDTGEIGTDDLISIIIENMRHHLNENFPDHIGIQVLFLT